MNIAFFDIQGWEVDYLKKTLKNHKLEFFNERLNIKNAGKAKDAEVLSVFIHSEVNEAILKAMPRLKFIATRSTGYDHIDLNECKKRNIIISNIPTYGENTVAEHTFALILALSRGVYKAHMKRLRGDFTLEGLKGFDLKGKTIGVVGMGHIGVHVVRIARGFDMNVLVCDVNKNPKLAKSMGFKYAGLNELLKKSDITTLHVPLCKATEHLINKNNIKLMKKGSILINTSRGEIVETEALIEALDKGMLKAAGLDVLEGEDLIKEEKQLLYSKQSAETWKTLARDHVLLSKDNVVYTPHMAFYSDEALHRIIEATAENITGFIDKKVVNVVR